MPRMHVLLGKKNVQNMCLDTMFHLSASTGRSAPESPFGVLFGVLLWKSKLQTLNFTLNSNGCVLFFGRVDMAESTCA